VRELVSIDIADGVALVVVDNPPVNALSHATLESLESAAVRIAASTEIRAVVLTGAGCKAFVAGADLDEFHAALGNTEWIEQHALSTRRVLGLWESLPQPVIAAVQAAAMGGGLELALVCDLIIADASVSFGFPEVRLGLLPGAGGTQRLPRRLPLNVAKQMLMLGEPMDAKTALGFGLVNRIAPPGEVVAEARQLAAKLARLPRRAVQGVKTAVAATTDLGLGLDIERAVFFEAFLSADATEGVDAFRAKRDPNFAHR
jgi:enoyl-CoA hydratase/carnithine racemase